MEFIAIIAIAIVVETLTEYVKKMLPGLANRNWAVLVTTVILGVAAAVAFRADIFAELGFASQIPYFGEVITGLLCAGGSNVIYDVVRRIQGDKTNDEE